MNIDRCYCYEVRFEDLKKVAEEEDASTIADLQAKVEFGWNCELCHPYVRRMLETGQTEFSKTLENE